MKLSPPTYFQHSTVSWKRLMSVVREEVTISELTLSRLWRASHQSCKFKVVFKLWTLCWNIFCPGPSLVCYAGSAARLFEAATEIATIEHMVSDCVCVCVIWNRVSRCVHTRPSVSLSCSLSPENSTVLDSFPRQHPEMSSHTTAGTGTEAGERRLCG